MNSRLIKLWIVLLNIAFVTVLSSCDDDEPPLADNVVNFGASELGFGDEEEVEVTLSLTRAADTDVAITVDIEATGVIYGTEFTTTPAASDGKISLTIPAGSDKVSFTVTKAEGIFLEGDERITFEIAAAGEPVLVGTTAGLELKFSAIVSQGSQLTLNGLIASEAGSSAGNSVFVDFSSNVQSPVARNTWDLGFYTGEDFRVIINNVNGASVVAVDKTDLNQVTEADVNPENLAVGFGKGTLDLIDDVFGDITNTAMAPVSAADAENKVYVINRAGGAGTTTAVSEFQKIRVLRTTNGYTLQYAKINDTSYKTLTITKDAQYNFQYVSFDNGAVTFEPAKARWDIQWTYSIFYSGDLPYSFSDLVFINHHGGAAAAEVLVTSSVTYDSFSESDLSGITLKSERNVISSHWRITNPSSSAAVRTDRFYVVKDPTGNIYKLKFISFHANDGGTRGKPVIEYALVKKGE